MLSNQFETTTDETTTEEWDQQIETDNGGDDGGFSSQDLRQMANGYFAQREFDSALPLYSMALDALLREQDERKQQQKQGDDDDDGDGGEEEESDIDLTTTFLCNRSACLFRMELYEDANDDALKAVEICKGRNVKASFRLAKTQIVMKEYTKAIATVEEALAKLKLSTAKISQDPDSKTPTPPNNNNDAQPSNNDAQPSNNNNITTTITQITTIDDDPTDRTNEQISELQKLLQTARTHHLKKKHNFTNAATLAKVESIRLEPRKPSIREFNIDVCMGEGNFSRVVSCHHTVTGEKFALKIIEKKKAESLAKQQHPNVYNEIEMEKRVLGVRLKEGEGSCERIVTMYHSFQDYNSLYFLMDMYATDLWSALRYKNFMVGIHPSLAKVHLYELLEALEFLHARGIVHRDLKAENMLLSSTGHIVLIDFGTAKDLLQTDLNGPEFVGTADFMSPEAVLGSSGDKEVKEQQLLGGGSDHTLDLWEFGAVIFQILTGSTPFNSPSPYLSFLKIQRGNLCRPVGIADDDAWDLIVRLMKVDPKERLGADCFEYIQGRDGDGKNKINETRSGYDVIRNHPYFRDLNSKRKAGDVVRPVASLRDLCVRACADLVQKDSLDLDIEKTHPPGDGSAHDMLRLKEAERRSLMDLLEKLRIISNPRVYRRFFRTKQEARLTKVREDTRDFMGLTQMNDKQHMFPTVSSEGGNNDISDMLVTMTPILFIRLTNPLFVKETNINCTDNAQRKEWIAQLKESLKTINKTRPKLVIATGYLDDECRKLIGKVNETIPVILNDGTSFFSFWSCGGEGLVLRARDFLQAKTERAQKEQMVWLRERVEQSRVARHHAFAFVDCDIKELPTYVLKTLAKGRVLCLFGISSGRTTDSKYTYSSSNDDTPIVSKDVQDAKTSLKDSTDPNSSSDSDAERSSHTMIIVQRGDSSLCCITLEEYGVWKIKYV